MRIGITGVTGFIGSALAHAALQQGHEIVAFSRQKGLNLPGAKEVRLFDLAEGATPDLGHLDAIVHLAGESVMGHWSEGKKHSILESRVQPTEAIVKALKTTVDGPKIFICASGTGYYGDRGNETLSEREPAGSSFLADVCVQWEAAAAAAESLGVRVVNLRTGMVLGREGGAWPLLRKIFKCFLGSRLSTGRQWVPWIHLDDEVGIILHALQHDSCRGPLNLGSPNPVTNAVMTHTIARVLHRPVMPPVPAFALRLVLGEMSTVTLESQRVLPEAVESAGYTFQHTDLEAALKSLI